VHDRLTDAVAGFASAHRLSPRETSILLKFVTEGKANKTIAAELGIGYPTVRLYWTRICQKTGCQDAVRACIAVVRRALASCPRCSGLDDTKIAPCAPRRDAAFKESGERLLGVAGDARRRSEPDRGKEP
jgi:DNA-binding CsgD family transcriptional regulator